MKKLIFVVIVFMISCSPEIIQKVTYNEDYSKGYIVTCLFDGLGFRRKCIHSDGYVNHSKVEYESKRQFEYLKPHKEKLEW